MEAAAEKRTEKGRVATATAAVIRVMKSSSDASRAWDNTVTKTRQVLVAAVVAPCEAKREREIFSTRVYASVRMRKTAPPAKFAHKIRRARGIVMPNNRKIALLKQRSILRGLSPERLSTRCQQ